MNVPRLPLSLYGLAMVFLFFTETVRADDNDTLRQIAENYGFAPVEEYHNLDPRKVALGRQLFHDPGFSSGGTVSCASCHDLSAGGDDGRAKSVGISGRPSAVNSPSVLFAARQFSQFWDGRAATLEEQINGPVEHQDEMASSWADIKKYLSENTAYRTPFHQIYGNRKRAYKISAADIRDAIAEFERSLVRANSKFDAFLRGDDAALSQNEKSGFAMFVDIGCASCHQGPLLGGNLFQKLGIMNDYFGDRGDVSAADYGRYNVTKNERDKFTFKVPSLRGVAETAPYLHDGSVPTLEAAVDLMTHYQLGYTLTESDRQELVAFLKSLSNQPPLKPQNTAELSHE